jgi:predicted 2-oxoglutarate/Fe(II)-dependent dioxygenase YbiX
VAEFHFGVLPYYIAGFLDAASCRRIRSRVDAGTPEPAEILSDAVELDVAVRRVATVDVDSPTLADLEARLDARREEIGTHFGVALTEREGASLLRYAAGDFYLPHVDRAASSAWPAAVRRQVAVVVFLNDDFLGGELSLIDLQLDVVPRAGLLVAFDAGTLHEVLPVQEGIRDVIVDWFY